MIPTRPAMTLKGFATLMLCGLCCLIFTSVTYGQTNPNTASEHPPTQKMIAAKNLLREFENLIPIEFSKDPEKTKELQAIIEEFQNGKPENVLKRVTEVARHPNYPPADVILAALSFASQDVKTGRLLLERAAVNHPDHPAVYAAFSQLAINGGRVTEANLLCQKLNSIIQQGTLEDSVKTFYHNQFLDGATDIAIRQQRFRDARVLLEQQRKNRPNHPKVLMVSAELEFKDNQIDQALHFLTQLQKVLPESKRPEIVIANWYQKQDNHTAAETWLKESLKKYPSDLEVQLELAQWAMSKEDFQEAEAAIKRAEQLGSDTLFSRELKARIAFAKEDFGIAEALYEQILKDLPRDIDVSNMYALCLLESKDQAKYDRALGIATRNSNVVPNNPIALASLGYIQFRGGDFKSARQSFAKTSRLSGQSAEIDFFFAEFLMKTGDPRAATAVLARALAEENLFLYRAAAKRLQDQLISSQLPMPKRP